MTSPTAAPPSRSHLGAEKHGEAQLLAVRGTLHLAVHHRGLTGLCVWGGWKGGCETSKPESPKPRAQTKPLSVHAAACTLGKEVAAMHLPGPAAPACA